jgi:uncharacterized membrane protein YgcG
VSARILAFVLLALVLVAVGCGGDEEGAPLPSAQVQLLNGRLDETQRRLDDGSAGACRDILNDTRPEVGKIIDSLPNDVDADVLDALVESFDNLWSVTEDRCQEAQQEEESQEPEPEPEPTQTEETETETAPPETDTTETTPPATEELPPEGDGDNDGGLPGDGNGNGNANGGGNGGGFGPGGAELGGGE